MLKRNGRPSQTSAQLLSQRRRSAVVVALPGSFWLFVSIHFIQTALHVAVVVLASR